MFKKTLLGAAIAAVAATSAAQADSFVDDSSLKISYKNYYWNENTNLDNRAGERDEWVHAVIADYQSGYFADIIGFDFSMAYADALDAKTDTSITNVPKGSDGKANSMGTVTVAYLKAKYDFSENIGVHGGYGAKKRGRLTYGDSGSRILDSSSYGVDLDFNVNGLDLYGTQITRSSQRNDSAFAEKLTNAAGEQIDHVNIFGAAYSFDNGLALAAEIAKSDDYLEKKHFQADYSIALQNDMSVDLNARYGTAEEDGKLYDNNSFYSSGSGDYESKYYNLNATLNFGNAYVGLGYNKTKDGDYNNTLFDADHGTMNSSADLWEMYALEDESAYILNAGYDFAEMVPGLTADVWYARGSGAKNVENFSRRELGTYVRYAFSGKLDGLSVAWLHTTYRASGQEKGDRTADMTGTLYDDDVNRLYLTYTYEVF